LADSIGALTSVSFQHWLLYQETDFACSTRGLSDSGMQAELDTVKFTLPGGSASCKAEEQNLLTQ